LFKLSNNALILSILDPAVDTARLGSRYCTGGYIWQIEDLNQGPLLTGPQYPSPAPLPFHGQGAPEAFVSPLGTDDVAVGGTVTVIGVGTVLRTSAIHPFHVRDNPTVQRFCSWKVEERAGCIRMTTEQCSGSYSLNLMRTVTLDERTVMSQTEVVNHSSVDLPISWFPHPFFPPAPDGRCCRFGFEWSLPDNAGYIRDEQGGLCLKREYPWEKGLFQQLGIPSGVELAAEIMHPAVGTVRVTTDYVLASLPVWANRVTFSPEAYQGRVVPAGERSQWEIRYRF
jgi:hypothetical protein